MKSERWEPFVIGEIQSSSLHPIAGVATVQPGSSADVASSPSSGIDTSLTASSIPTGYTPEATAWALTARNDLAKLLMSISDSQNEQGKLQASNSGDSAATLRTNNFHAQVNMDGLRKQAVKIATEREDAVNAQLSSGKGFGTSGIAGMTDAQVGALSTDDLVNRVNDTLTTGVAAVKATTFGNGNFKTEMSDMLNSIQDTKHAKGEAGYVPGALDRVQDRLVETSDSMNAVADEAMKTTDPVKLNQLMTKMMTLQVELHQLLKEQEKLEAIQRLIMQLMMGCPTVGAIKKLKELGLGGLAEDLLRAFVKQMRKTGQTSPQIIAVLQAAGFGNLVASDDAEQKVNEAKDAKKTAAFYGGRDGAAQLADPSSVGVRATADLASESAQRQQPSHAGQPVS